MVSLLNRGFNWTHTGHCVVMGLASTKHDRFLDLTKWGVGITTGWQSGSCDSSNCVFDVVKTRETGQCIQNFVFAPKFVCNAKAVAGEFGSSSPYLAVFYFVVMFSIGYQGCRFLICYQSKMNAEKKMFPLLNWPNYGVCFFFHGWVASLVAWELWKRISQDFHLMEVSWR